jgi:hypothetical protein
MESMMDVGAELADLLDGNMTMVMPGAHQAGADAAGAHQAAAPGPGFELVGGVAAVRIVRAGKRLWDVAIARPDGEMVFQDEVNLASAKARAALVAAALGRLGPGAVAAAAAAGVGLAAELEERLMAEAATATAPAADGGGAEAADEVTYAAVDEGAGCGLYAIAGTSSRRLSNFSARILEEVVETDIDEVGTLRTHFCGEVRIAGRTGSFRLTPEQYTDKLEPAIYAAAGPSAKFLGTAAEFRRAISHLSEEAGFTTRRVITSPGWDEAFTRYSVPGGYVDAAGYHAAADGDGVPAVDLSGNDYARRLGLLRLDGERLAGVKHRLLDDFLALHDRNVSSAVLAAVPLAILLRRAGLGSWPALWLVGQSGVGKTVLARLAYNFFADAAPDGTNTVASWISTGNALPAIGHGFRDSLFLVDDYKRESVDHKVVKRVLQNYADRSSRSQMTADQGLAVTKPIRGLLLGTGEDVPEAGASGLGRSVIIRVPQPPTRDPDRLDRCLADRPLYRGVTADLIAYTLREGVAERFRDRVGHWQRHYLGLIAGRGNDARIAANHAALAAAFGLFGAYMGDVWAGAAEAARAFAEDYVAGLVTEAAGGVADEMPAAIFLRTLAELLDSGGARIEHVPAAPGVSLDVHERAPLVGRLQPTGRHFRATSGRNLGGDQVLLQTSAALAVVQERLRALGRPDLRASERALIDQLAELGHLLDDGGRPIAAGYAGNRTTRARRGDGTQLRAARIPAGVLLPPATEAN